MTNQSDTPQILNAPQRSGTNQTGVKEYNERLIIDIVSGEKDGLSKADITRITGLSAQTVTTIVDRLIDDGLLTKGETIKGKIGQPSTPILLAKDGAISIGVKIGRRSLNIVIMNFQNEILCQANFQFDYPERDYILDKITISVQKLKSKLTQLQRSRIVGIGIATPFELEGWEGVILADRGSMLAWKDFDIRAAVEAQTGIHTLLLNDATAACLAELRINKDLKAQSALYYYIGTFLGGGIILDGQIYNGKTGYAGSVGSIPSSINLQDEEKPRQLVNAAALNELETLSEKENLNPDIFQAERVLSTTEMEVFEKWAEPAASALCFAILTGQAYLDISKVIIDASLSRNLLSYLVKRVKEKFEDYDTQGIAIPEISAGVVGLDARAIGGAFLPFADKFALDQSALLKSK